MPNKPTRRVSESNVVDAASVRMPPAAPLEWKRRTRTEWRNDFHHRIWETKDAAYRVVRSRTELCAVYGRTPPVTFYAIAVSALPNGRRCESIISRHRTRDAAFAACQAHAHAAAAKPLQPKLALVGNGGRR